MGTYTPVFSDKHMVAYTRQAEGRCFLVVLNLSHRPCYFKPRQFAFSGIVEVAPFPEWEGMRVKDQINLGGDEAFLVRLD